LLSVQRIPTGKWRENCYIIHDKNLDALLIDPGANSDLIFDAIREKKVKLHAIINTHGHYDHIGAVHNVKEHFGVPFYLHSGDLDLLRSANFYRKFFDSEESISIPTVDAALESFRDGLVLHNFRVRVIHTPGHTPGSVCLEIDGHLFTGDTLFRGKIGTTRLPGGNTQILNQSLKFLSQLDPELKIFPGHGSSSTIGEELLNNEELKRAIQ